MGGAASGRIGSRYERELVNAFRDAGWGALRLPASGGATERELPDVLAGRSTGSGSIESYVDGNPWDSVPLTEAWAIEAKAGKATTLYVDAEEVEALRTFAEIWGARPLLGARSTRQGTPTAHYLVPPERARVTDSGTYGLPIDGIEDRAYAVVGSDGVSVIASKSGGSNGE